MSTDLTCAPPVLLTGPILGGVVFALLSVTTTLYLTHDRDEAGGWGAMKSNEGYWPEPTADFDWCEINYVYTPYVAELWNSVTSLLFCVGPILLWSRTRDLQVRLNLALVVAIGLGSFAFHATLQYRDQLLDELPMITYIAHTVAMLSRKDVSCPPALWCGFVALWVLLFATAREDAAHRAGRVVMVLSFSGCFVWLASSLATVTATLDKGDPGGGYVHTRRYQSGSLTVLISIVFWVTDNMGCAALHSLPFGLPYPQLHATVWHTGMSYVCFTLCEAVVGRHRQHAREVASAQSE